MDWSTLVPVAVGGVIGVGGGALAAFMTNRNTRRLDRTNRRATAYLELLRVVNTTLTAVAILDAANIGPPTSSDEYERLLVGRGPAVFGSADVRRAYDDVVVTFKLWVETRRTDDATQHAGFQAFQRAAYALEQAIWEEASSA
jgi:hypothetical protein